MKNLVAKMALKVARKPNTTDENKFTPINREKFTLSYYSTHSKKDVLPVKNFLESANPTNRNTRVSSRDMGDQNL